MSKSGKKAGSVALVVAQGSALCRCVAEALLGMGMSKVYATTSGAEAPTWQVEESDGRVVPMQLDPLSHRGIKDAAKACNDVTLLFNLSPAVAGMGRCHTVNRVGALGLNLAFVPVIAANGGGVMINAMPDAAQMRLQLQAIAGRALQTRNIHLHCVELDSQRALLQPSEAQVQQLFTMTIEKLIKEFIR